MAIGEGWKGITEEGPVKQKLREEMVILEREVQSFERSMSVERRKEDEGSGS